MRRELVVLLGPTVFMWGLGCNAVLGNEQGYLASDSAAIGVPEENTPEAGDSETTGGQEDGSASDSSSGAASCTPQCSGTKLVCDHGTCVECLTGSGMCTENTPSSCTDAKWVPQTACSGATPVCSYGKCTSAKLTGGLVTLANGVLSAGNVHLVEHGLEHTPTTCGMLSGKQVCVTGGVRP